MNKNKTIIFLLITTFLFTSWFALNMFSNSDKMKEIIQNQLPENIGINYEKLNTNILMGDFSIEKAEIKIKDKGILADAGKIKLTGFSYIDLLMGDEISLESSFIEKANITIDKTKIDTVKHENSDKKNTVIKLDNFNLDLLGLQMIDSKGTKVNIRKSEVNFKKLTLQTNPKNIENVLDYQIINISTDSIQLPLSNMQSLNIGKLELDSTSFRLKNANLTLKDRGIDVKFNQLNLNGNYMDDIFEKDTIHFKRCLLNKGEITINNAKKQTAKTKATLHKMDKTFIIDDFKVADTDFEFLDTKEKTQLKFSETNAFFKNLKIRTAAKDQENTISYDFISLACKNVKHSMVNLHDIEAADVFVSQEKAEFNQLKMYPVLNKSDFQKKFQFEQDMINLEIPKITIKDYDFSFDNNNKFLSSSHVLLNQPILNVYRDKTQPDPIDRKPLYSEMLRNLDFHLNVQKIDVHNANITYEELSEKNQQPGKIYFEKFDASISNLNNKSNNDLVKIDVNTFFMGHSPTQVYWRFHIQHPADFFQISGNIRNLRGNSLNSFLVYNMKAKISGIVQETTFDFKGNDNEAKGKMEMLFNDVNVEILDKNKDKKGILSTIANFLVKKNKDEKDNHEIKVERDPKKSFFNLFWISLKEGLKANMMKFKGKD